MTVTAESVVRCEAEVAAARERLRIEVRALGLPDDSLAGIALMRVVADHPRFTFPAVAKTHGYGVTTYQSAWSGAGMPSIVIVRDHVRAHLLASLLQHRGVSGARAGLELGENGPNAVRTWLQRVGHYGVREWRRTHTVASTLAAWRVFLLDHREAMAAFVPPTVTPRPDVSSHRRAVEILAERLAHMKAELALVEAA